MSARSLFIVLHPERTEAHRFATEIAQALQPQGFDLYTNSEIDIANINKVSSDQIDARVKNCELVLVLGGDGTILRGAEFVHGKEIPILGINLGHVGFLAQIGKPTPDEIVKAVVTKSYRAERRMTLSYRVERDSTIVSQGWALNEVAVERNTEQMIELFVQIDHRPLSRWGCDGVICATPTGSTAYAFSEIGRAHV